MSKLLFNYINNKGVDCCIINHEEIPFKHTITMYPYKGKLCGSWLINNREVNLKDISAIYTRFDSASLAEENISANTKIQIETERQICFNVLFENIDSMVINKPKAQFSNFSKLYQSFIINQYGLKIPNAIISNNKEEVENFIKTYKKNGVIYKSASSERSIVKKFTDKDFKKLDLLKNCPHLFQECISGKDIRVHALATGETFACEINSDESDYRYDNNRNIVPIKIPKKISEICVKLTLNLGLYCSGIDLRKTNDNEYYCFEVNPSPAFSWYEYQTGLPISKAIAEMMLNAHKYKNLAVRKF